MALLVIAYAYISAGAVFKLPEPEVNRDIMFKLRFFQLLDYSNVSGGMEKPKLQLTKGSAEVREEENSGDLRIDVHDFVVPADSIEDDSGKTTQFNPFDSTFNADSLALDSTMSAVDSMALDSTARLKHFKVQRKDKPTLSLYQRKPSSFYTKPSTKKRVIEIDSSGEYVEVREYIGNELVKVAMRMTLEEYLESMMDARRKKLWDELAYQYELKSTDVELGQFLSDITELEIPLPSVGLLSIFGPPKINLRIGGAVDIHAAWRNESQEGLTTNRLGNTRNEPNFKQQVQVNVDGTIGDKLHITADWNTERTFEYENQLKIIYTGYEDEIIQSIEAGNVSLQTSGLVGGSEALFGIKANMQLGPFDLTTLVSQKKGEIKEKTVSGGTQTQEFEIRAYDYSENHYFVDTIYADTSENLNIFYKNFIGENDFAIQEYRISNMEVWKSTQQLISDNAKEREGIAYIDLQPRQRGASYPENLRDGDPVAGRIEKQRFVLLREGKDYIYNENAGFISFKTSIMPSEAIAVAYTIDNQLPEIDDDLTYGEYANESSDDSSRIILKLIKPSNLQPKYTTAWKLMLKNIYPVGGRNVKSEGFEFDVYYERAGEEELNTLGGEKLLQAFALDQFGQSGTPPPDGKFDFRMGKTIFQETGEIIFPVLQPFGKNLPDGLPDAEELRYQAIYDTSKTFARQNKDKDKWVMKGVYSGEASSTYQLGFNIVENSVKVYLDGNLLTPNVDYTVDYNIGLLTIMKSEALVPGANLRITYEENDLFQLASKTLVGARGVFNFSNKTKLGFSFLNLNQQTLSDKVRIGEEPLSNSIFGMDFNTSAELPFVTDALNAVFNTRAPSQFSLTGEWAYMSPDPNTKKSNIRSDNGESIAYIDDFEGSKRIIPIGISYTTWKDLSFPIVEKASTDSVLTDMEQMSFKGKSWWFNITPSNVRTEHIWPEKKVGQNEDQITVMDYVFDPSRPGFYNWEPDLSDPTRAWGGIMKILSTTANNLVEENMEFIEFWAKLETVPEDAVITIDLGKISEDVIPNGKLDTEDNITKNTLLDDGEDRGLDGIKTEFEEGTTDDPAKDNFRINTSLSVDAFQNINGTEGNSVITDGGGVFPDTEDLNRNGNLDELNDYFQYEIPLDTNTATNPYIAGGGNNAGWYLFRIPLKEYTREVGDPSLTLIEAIRLWVSGVDQRIHLRLTEFNLVGSQWQRVLPDDSVLSISVVNIEDNPEYSSPPGVERERDLTRPDQDILRNEQSLNLQITDLEDGEHREAVKYLYRPIDVFNYREMKLFIHGPEHNALGSVSYNSAGEPAAEVYFRFGTDSSNFYEYRQPVGSGWNEIKIDFESLTALKQTRDSVNQLYSVPVPGEEGHQFAVKGNPTLTTVKYLLIGVYNTNNQDITGPISGDIWVNELRLIGADDTPGWAYTVSSSFTAADIFKVNFNMSETDPYFHRLAERFGSRATSKNWGFSTELNVLKLLPFNLKESNFRISYSRTENISDPLFTPGTDISVAESQKLLQQNLADSVSQKEIDRQVKELEVTSQTLNTSDTWTMAGIKFIIPVEHWLVQSTINKLTYNFTYNKTFQRNPNTEKASNWSWNASVNYAYNFGRDNYFYPADIPVLGTLISLLSDYRNVKVHYLPNDIKANANLKRNKSLSITRPRLNAPSQESISRDFTSGRGFGFSWKVTEGGFLNTSFSYDASFASSLLHLETDRFGEERSESEIWNEIFESALFGRDFRYSQSFSLKTAPKLPSLLDLDKYLSLGFSYGANYQWNNNFQQEVLGRSVGVANRTNINLRIRLKDIFKPLFETKDEAPAPPKKTRSRDFKTRDFGNTDDTKQDSIDIPENDSLEVDDNKPSSLSRMLNVLKMGFYTLFLDYENINIDYSINAQVNNGAIYGDGTGLGNFWGITYDESKGPSRSYMLGLDFDPGRRASIGNQGTTISDKFTEKNNFSFSTSRPLWEGAKLDLNWKVGWSINKSVQVDTENGEVFFSNPQVSGSITRSFISLPPVLIFSIFDNGIAKVKELYGDGEAPDAQLRLSNAFLEGFETFPWLSKIPLFNEFTKYIPRANWRLSWSGLEKIPLLEGFTEKVTLDHSFSSEYTEGWKYIKGQGDVIQTQRISYGFSPLIGLSITFASIWDGNLTGGIKFGSKSSYDLGITTQNITETNTNDIGFNIRYNKSGFELPLFGINLKNDIEFSFDYTMSSNLNLLYDMNEFNEEGEPQNGRTTVTLEPRVKYIISSRVTLAVFYKRVDTTPEGASIQRPTTTNEAGLDIRISIQ